jgi:toxin ParE1/3/4
VPVEWHPRARKDIFAIAEFILDVNPTAVGTIIHEIARQVGMLAKHPSIGRPGRVPGTRELVIQRTPYIAAYRVVGKSVTVLRVLHGIRKWPAAFAGAPARSRPPAAGGRRRTRGRSLKKP